MKNFSVKFLFLVSCCIVYYILHSMYVFVLTECESISRIEDFFSWRVVAVNYFLHSYMDTK